MGVLRSAAHRRAESRFWGVFIFAVHRAFVLGLGARHRGIVDLSEGVIRCVTVFACYSSSSSFFSLILRDKSGVSYTYNLLRLVRTRPGRGGRLAASIDVRSL